MAYIERTGVTFEDKKYAEKCWTHDIDVLDKRALLTDKLDAAKAAIPQLDNNWLILKDWSEVDRYRFATSTGNTLEDWSTTASTFIRRSRHSARFRDRPLSEIGHCDADIPTDLESEEVAVGHARC